MRSNSKAVAGAIAVYKMSEPLSTDASGIYLGKTSVYKLPFYLDCSRLINPHMAIIGISGAGKSYMVKSFVAKSVLHQNSMVLAVDWNDEYKELIEFLSGKILSFGKDFRINIMDVYSSLGGISNITELIDNMIELDQGQKSKLHGYLLELFSQDRPRNLSELISKAKEGDAL
jgi:type IV secretory pathway VirB4 component